METPLSTRRITRSLAAAATASAQKSAAAADPSCRSKKPAAGDAPPRAALHDITNDSPIVGLAAGGLGTPQASTAGAKNRARPRCTPGSGEALLRGQVKTLLQKVDEEGAAAIQPLRIHALLGVARSPAQLLAPTPANTPQLWAGPAASLLLPDGLAVMPCVLEEEELIPKLQVIVDPPANRALVFDDSPEKSDLTTDGSVASSSLTFHGSSSGDRSADDDGSSVWSMQVNVSSEKDEEELGLDTVGELEEEYYTEEELEQQYYTEEEDWEEEDDDECFDELCEGMSKMSVLDEHEEKKKKVGLPPFEGRHTRFVYNSDDEIVERKDVENAAAEHGALLRGLPVREGKHLRFHDDDDDEE